MSNGTLPFSDKAYDKLTMAVFPTLRRRDKYGGVGDVNEVEHGPRSDREVIGQAEIVAKEKVTLLQLNNEFFKFDTQTDTVAQAKESINSFYRNDIERDEELTLYWNRWVDVDG